MLTRLSRRLFVAAAFACSTLPADADVGGRADVLLLGDRVLFRASLRTETYQKETHVVLDYAAPVALDVHRDILPAFTFGEGERTLKIVADGLRLEVDKTALTSRTSVPFSKLTARYANELGNVDVTAVLGWSVLRQFALGLNLAEGELTLATAQQAGGADPDAVVTGLYTLDDIVHVPVTHAGEPAWMTFGTAGYHTYLNQALAKQDDEDIYFGLGSLGDDQALRIDSMVALFPQPFTPTATPDGGLLLRSGLGLWSAYALEINPAIGYLALTPVANSNYSDADAAFYRAAAAKDVDGLKAYAARWPQDRNIEEAAALLFELGLAAGASVDEQLQAVRLGLASRAERQRLEYVFRFAAALHQGEHKDSHTALIIGLCNEAMRHIDRADKPRLRQRVQLMLGDRHLYRGEPKEAWKVFLAAGFNGDPRLDSVVRHELGRAYEELGRHRRAYSSYQRALSQPTSLLPWMQANAQAGLERLRPRLDADDPLLDQDHDG